MEKGAAKYIGKLLIQRVLGLVLYLIGAGWVLDFRASVYFAIYILAAVVSGAVMYRLSPETLAQRNKANTDSPRWDKELLGIFWVLAYFGIYLAAGLSVGNVLYAAPWLFWVGIGLQVLASVLALWALAVNAYLESTARIQTDRDQQVCVNGPYRVIRHPTYLAILLWCSAVAKVFGTLAVALIADVIAVIIIIRTILEDKMLKAGLPGYAEYTEKVKYRLFPFVW